MDPFLAYETPLKRRISNNDVENLRQYLRVNIEKLQSYTVRIFEILSEMVARGSVSNTVIDVVFDEMAIRRGINVKYIRSEEDIHSLLREIQETETDDIIFVTRYVYDPKMMMRYGLFPSSSDMSAGKHVTDYMRDMPYPNLMFWHPKYFRDGVDPFQHIYSWRYQSLNTHIAHAEMSPESLALSLLSDEPYQYVFRSGRARTKMHMYNKARSHRARRSDLITIDGQHFYTINNTTYRAIPVTRYEHGMSRGLYYNSGEELFCGTFYYAEGMGLLGGGRRGAEGRDKALAVASLEGDDGRHGLEGDDMVPTYLLCRPDRVLTSFCKTTAMKELGDDTMDLDEHENLRLYIEGVTPPDLRLTPQQLGATDPSILPTKEYAGVFLGLYALEDDLDQPLCNLASEKGIDIIILTHMVGSHQVVSEVLDTRDRSDSFSSLLFITDNT
jgi:hypothetical protein